jgi:hypothetical protein
VSLGAAEGRDRRPDAAGFRDYRICYDFLQGINRFFVSILSTGSVITAAGSQTYQMGFPSNFSTKVTDNCIGFSFNGVLQEEEDGKVWQIL